MRIGIAGRLLLGALGATPRAHALTPGDRVKVSGHISSHIGRPIGNAVDRFGACAPVVLPSSSTLP